MSSGWVAACSAVSWICSFTACLACIPDLDPFSKKAWSPLCRKLLIMRVVYSIGIRKARM